jgi:hypothetical protein
MQHVMEEREKAAQAAALEAEIVPTDDAEE